MGDYATESQKATIQFLNNNIGALINASNFEGKERKESVIALFMEVVTGHIIENNNNIDMKASMPIFKSCKWILENHKNNIYNDTPDEIKNNISNQPYYLMIDNLINLLTELINNYDNYINNIDK